MIRYIIEKLLGYSYIRQLVMDTVVQIRCDEQRESLREGAYGLLIDALFRYSQEIGYPKNECATYVKKWERLHKQMIKNELDEIMDGFKPYGRKNELL